MLTLFALAAFGGGCIGWALCLASVAAQARVQADAVRDGVCDQYAALADGRVYSAERAASYAEGE